MSYFPEISLLITHYKRSKSLEHLLDSFASLNCHFGEIIISDDCSPMEHIIYIENVLSKKYAFKLIKTDTNKGLGNNINKGQDAVTKPYTLYIQEDFEPQPEFPSVLERAFQYMQEDSSLDLARFYAYQIYPYLKPFDKDLQFSLLHIPKYAFKYFKIYYYSDHPHLRRSNFLKKFGRYKEKLKGDRTEYWMCISMIQHKGKAIFYNQFDKLFLQKNSIAEPSTMTRNEWKWSNNFIISGIRYIYRQVRYNYDIFFKKHY